MAYLYLFLPLHNDSRREFGTFARSVRVITSAQLLHGRSAADLSPAYAAPPSLVPYTNRPLGHQRRYTKRFAIAEASSTTRREDE